MNWDTIKLFLALYRAGSARAVAQEFDLSPSTVTRRITDLEKKLDTKLFNRLPSGFKLTESGQELLHTALRMESDAYEIERKLHAKSAFMQGKIKITLPYHLITEPMMRIFSRFSDLHPKVDLEIVPSYQSFDLEKGEADIALRLMYKDGIPPEDLIGTKVVDIYCAVYGSRQYLDSHDLGNPEKTNWIGWNEDTQFPDWVTTSDYPHLPARHQLNDPLMQLYAVKSGMGLAMMPCFLCDPEPEILRVPAHHKWHRFDIWMLSHPDLRETMRFREFRQFLRDQLHAEKHHWNGDVYAR